MPVVLMRGVVWLYCLRKVFFSLPGIGSRSPSAALPAGRRPWLHATSSTSTVVWPVSVCVLAWPHNGQQLCGPINARKTPYVDVWSPLSPAKPASVKGLIPTYFLGSPTKPICLHSVDPIRYRINRMNFRSRVLSTSLLLCSSAPSLPVRN